MSLFGKTTTHRGTNLITSDELVLKVGNNTEARTEFLVQNYGIPFYQPITRLFEISSSYVFFSPGRSLGSFQIGRIVGRYIATEVFGAAGTGPWTTDVDKGDAASRTMVLIEKAPVNIPGLSATRKTGLRLGLIMSGTIIESIGYASDANGLLLQENISGQFAGLSLRST